MKVVKPQAAVRSYAPSAAACSACHTDTAAASQSTPGVLQKRRFVGGFGIPTGKSQLIVVWNCSAFVASTLRRNWQESTSYTGEPGVVQTSTSPNCSA
jgi:hypothetical protein